MNKMIIAALTLGALATYLLIKKKAYKPVYDPVIKNTGNEGKHITDIFSRAKKYGM